MEESKRMDVYTKMVEEIIKEQENIVGPLAWEQAKKVSGLKINAQTREISFEGEKKSVLEKLVEQYNELFGRASIEVCRDAVKGYLSQVDKAEIPDVLQ